MELLLAVNAENSRAKVQNVGGYSSAPSRGTNRSNWGTMRVSACLLGHRRG